MTLLSSTCLISNDHHQHPVNLTLSTCQVHFRLHLKHIRISSFTSFHSLLPLAINLIIRSQVKFLILIPFTKFVLHLLLQGKFSTYTFPSACSLTTEYLCKETFRTPIKEAVCALTYKDSVSVETSYNMILCMTIYISHSTEQGNSIGM